MSDFSSSLKLLTEKLNKFIKEYEVIEDKDPLNMNLLKSFKKKIQHFNNASSEYIVLLKKYKLSFDKLNKINEEINKKEINEKNEKLNVALEIIKSKYESKNSELKNNIKEAKIDLKNKINELDLDVNFFISSSNQKSAIYDDEYEQNIKKYNYQIETAQDTYNSNIKIFNDDYLEKLEIIEKEYEETIKKIDLETNKINDDLNSRISEYKNLLKRYLKNLSSVNFEIKEKNRLESVTLNKEIKDLIDERNFEIVKARDSYTSSLNDSSSAKEEKHQQYQSEGQKIQKDFVISISKQDEYSNNYKKEYEYSINEEKKNYYYNKLNETLKQNEAITNLNNEFQDEKSFKKRLKMKNKYYYLKYLEYKNETEKKLNYLEHNYQIQSEEIRFNKSLLELEKNHNIKVINNKEQTYNKYYQQLDSIYENDMNLSIKIANLKYNKRANTAKCASRIRLKSIEKESDVAEANLQKKIEGLNAEIAKLETEIKLHTDLKNSSFQYETLMFNNHKKNLNVSNTLEIEKCKILYNYNKRQFADNILISKSVLNHGKETLEIENNKCVDIHDITIDIEKENLNYLISTLNYKMKFNQQYQLEDENIQKRNTRYEIDVLKNSFSQTVYKNEIKLINQTYSIFINLVKELELFSNSFFIEFFNNVLVRPEYEKMISNFIKNFEVSISSYYENILNDFSNYINLIVENRLSFNELNKFKHYYNDLDKQKNEDLKILNNKKAAIEDTIKTYNESLANYSNRVFNLRNQRELIRQKIESKDVKNKDSLKNDFKNYTTKINEFNKRFNEVSKLREDANLELKAINERINKTNLDYDARVDEIKSMQANSSSAFIYLNNSIKKYIQNIISQEMSFKNIYKFDFSILTDNHINKEIIKRANLIENDNNIIFNHIYENINNFRLTMNKSMQKEKELLFSKFQNDIYHISLRTNNILQDLESEMDDKNNTIKNKINNLENKKKNTIKNYDQKFLARNNSHLHEIDEINLNKQISLNRFYDEFYSMVRNQDELNNIHTNMLKDLNNNYNSEKFKLNNKAVFDKKDVSNKLDQFIESKESLINHLPVATKFFVDNISKEKDISNQEIDIEIKNAKIEASQNKKAIEKAISNIELTGNQELELEKAIYEKNLNLEKKKHNRIIKKYDRTKIEYNI